MHRHSFDPASFLFGLLFIGVAGWVLIGNAAVWSLDTRWLWPLVLIGAGLLLFGSVLGGAAAERRRIKRQERDHLGDL